MCIVLCNQLVHCPGSKTGKNCALLFFRLSGKTPFLSNFGIIIWCAEGYENENEIRKTKVQRENESRKGTGVHLFIYLALLRLHFLTLRFRILFTPNTHILHQYMTHHLQTQHKQRRHHSQDVIRYSHTDIQPRALRS